MKQFWVLVVLLAMFAVEANAGVLYARRPGTETPVYNLRISHIRTSVRIAGQLAVTHVDEEFYNENNQILEGFYAFSLPEGAKVDGLWLWVNGQRLTFIVKTREEAQRLYDSVVVGQRRDPAILESLGKNRFQLKVFPINPHSSRRVEIQYFTTLPLTTDGWVHYRYPLNLTGYQTQPVEQTTLRIDVESKLPVEGFATNFDANPLLCRTTVFSEYSYRVEFGLEQQLYTQDFEVRYKPRDVFSVFPALVWSDPDEPTEDPYFICWHPLSTDDGIAAPRDLVFVLDASGSMDENRMKMVEDAVIGVLQQLVPNDRFRIVLFSDFAVSWPNTPAGMADATPENVTAGTQYIRQMYESGGNTNYEQAFTAGFNATFRPNAVRRMLFLTDGQPTVGNRTYDGLLNLIRTNDTVGVILNPVIVFSDKIDLLYDLASDRGGKVTLVETGTDLQTVLQRVMLELGVAGVRAPSITYEQNKTYFVYPRSFPALTSMENLYTTGRFFRGAQERAKLTYLDAENKLHSVTNDVDFGLWTTDLKQVGSFWAAHRIDELLERIKNEGSTAELILSVVNLSIKHQILTPYTAFLVLETNPVDPTDVEGSLAALPQSIVVQSAYPNPFQSKTNSELAVPVELRERQGVRIVVTDILGREIAVLHDGELSAGKHIIRWNGKGRDGGIVRPGVYFLRVTGNGVAHTLKLTILS